MDYLYWITFEETGKLRILINPKKIDNPNKTILVPAKNHFEAVKKAKEWAVSKEYEDLFDF